MIASPLEGAWTILERMGREAPGQLSDRLGVLMARRGKRLRSTLLLLFAQPQGGLKAALSSQQPIGGAGATTGADPQGGLDAASIAGGSRRGLAVSSDSFGSGSASGTVLTADLDEHFRLCAAAVELLHLASLAHDDVIDESKMRRGLESAPQRWGNKMAVLVGDYAFARSMELVIATGRDRIVRAINLASSRLVAGEVAELDFAASTKPTLAAYREVIYLKTAALLEACAYTGALLGGLSEDQVAAAARFGAHFGLAFQMCDDLLDLGIGGENDKPSLLDLHNGVLGLPVLLHLEMTGEDLRARAGSRWSRAPSDSPSERGSGRRPTDDPRRARHRPPGHRGASRRSGPRLPGHPSRRSRASHRPRGCAFGLMPA